MDRFLVPFLHLYGTGKRAVQEKWVGPQYTRAGRVR